MRYQCLKVPATIEVQGGPSTSEKFELWKLGCWPKSLHKHACQLRYMYSLAITSPVTSYMSDPYLDTSLIALALVLNEEFLASWTPLDELTHSGTQLHRKFLIVYTWYVYSTPSQSSDFIDCSKGEIHSKSKIHAKSNILTCVIFATGPTPTPDMIKYRNNIGWLVARSIRLGSIRHQRELAFISERVTQDRV